MKAKAEKKTEVYWNPDGSRVEKKGSWFVSFDADGTRIGAKMSYKSAMTLTGNLELAIARGF